MPTGYTAIIEEKGCTFPEFVWRCARAFGALVEMRDEPLGAAVPEAFPLSTYHAEQKAKAEQRLRDLQAMTMAEATARAEAEYAEQTKAWRESELRRRAVLARYDAIQSAVELWTPPTDDHNALRDFMLQQIDASTRFMREPHAKPERMDGGAWLDAQIASVKWDVDYHAKETEKDRDQAEKRTAWIAALRKSVPATPERP